MTENLSGVEIRKTFHKFPLWMGRKINDSYGGKTVLDYSGTPLFAELFALRIFKEKGFDGVWADTYRRTFRTSMPEKEEVIFLLPDFVNDMLISINPDGKMTGTWDLVLWKERQISFVELKRQGKDKIRQTQISFLNRAVNVGVSKDNFEILEWFAVIS